MKNSHLSTSAYNLSLLFLPNVQLDERSIYNATQEQTVKREKVEKKMLGTRGSRLGGVDRVCRSRM
jgi:hypothetical protein